jgi:membrane protein DedA with SNARE-associated domain
MVAGVFSWVNDLTDWLSDVSANWWFLAIIVAIAFLDSIIPVVPSETCVIIGGVAAAEGSHPIWAVIACAAGGAFAGDNTAYLIGRRAAAWFDRRAMRRPAFGKRLGWAREQIRERGGLLLITARFIPGGRTALTLSSGITRQRPLWFICWIAVAAAIWAAYASLLGYVGGKAFKDNHTAAFIVAFAAALSITVVIEVVRYSRNKRRAGALLGD